MPDLNPQNEFKRGKVIKAESLQWMADKIRYLLNFSTGPGLEPKQYPNGWGVVLVSDTNNDETLGLLQGQIHQMVTDKRDGWDFPLSAP